MMVALQRLLKVVPEAVQRERVRATDDGGPSKVAEGCSGGCPERVRATDDGGPSKVAEGCSGGCPEREYELPMMVALQRLLKVVPEAVQRESTSYR